MKTFEEFLNEAVKDNKEWAELNKDRIGKTLLDGDGNEIKGSVVLSMNKNYQTYMKYDNHGGATITREGGRSNDIFYLNKDEIKAIKAGA